MEILSCSAFPLSILHPPCLFLARWTRLLLHLTSLLLLRPLSFSTVHNHLLTVALSVLYKICTLISPDIVYSASAMTSLYLPAEQLRIM
jgi:hypothetical protein